MCLQLAVKDMADGVKSKSGGQKEEEKRAFDAADTDKDELVSFTEFSELPEIKGLSTEKQNENFLKFDKNNAKEAGLDLEEFSSYLEFKDAKVQKSMTQMMGIFYMMYETEEAGGFTIFNENGMYELCRYHNGKRQAKYPLHLPPTPPSASHSICVSVVR